MNFTFQQIFHSLLFQKTIQKFLGKESIEIVKRPACFSVQLKKEGQRFIKRIIVLPPKGFTGNKINLLNPHPETRSTRVRILGKINPDKKGFKPLMGEVKFIFSLKKNISTESKSPYAKFSKKYCDSQIKSWRNWFYVVRENGWGNFHSLINFSDEWVVILLEKNLIDQKPINLESFLRKLSKQDATRLRIYLQKVEQLGDGIFKHPLTVNTILKFPLEILIPILIRMLNIQETGRHEPCTFFALLLKIANQKRNLVLKELEKAIELKLAPYYYLEDLQKKLGKGKK